MAQNQEHYIREPCLPNLMMNDPSMLPLPNTLLHFTAGELSA